VHYADNVRHAAASAGHWVATHKVEVGLMVLGTVAIVGGAVLTGGLADAALLAAASVGEEGASMAALETADLASHVPLALLLGLTTIGAGAFVDSIGAGLNTFTTTSTRSCKKL